MKTLVKLSRYAKARAKLGSSIPVFWHIGEPNFGDDINPALFAAIANQKVRFARRREQPHFMGMGSILGKATENCTVLGSGYIQPPEPECKAPGKVVAVRGELTRSFLEGSSDALLGDPMVLLDRLYSFPKRSGDTIGFVPHVAELRRAEKMAIPGIKIINAAHDPMRVIHEIHQCRRVYCQSLHSLIVADTLRIPNVWIAPSQAMKGGKFKFMDYFSTLDTTKSALPFTRETFATTPNSEFDAAQYRFDKGEYLDALRDTLCRPPH